MTSNAARNEPAALARRSDSFVHEFGRILGVPASAVASATKCLFPSGLSDDRKLLPMEATETAELICGCLAEGSDKHVLDVVDQFAGMEFQCEVGPEATSDSRWHPRPRDRRKRFFGTQLSAVLESSGSRDDDRTGLSPAIRAGLSLGWTPNGTALGLLQFDRPQRHVSFLYASAPVLTKLTTGIRLNELELETSVRLDVDPARLQHLARVVRDLRRSRGENATRDQTHLPELGDLEDAMWCQGWGLFKNSDGVYQIGRIDADRRFANDDEAVKHVQALAAMGEPLHEHTMRLHLTDGAFEPRSTVFP